MELTICIPCFEDARNVDNLLMSIFQCDTEGLTYEILVCDGDSQDGIEQVVRSWQTRLPVNLISTFSGASASVNINAGALHAKGDIFCRIDSHCLVTRLFVKNGLREFKLRLDSYAALGPSVNVVASRDSVISDVISKLFMSPFLLGPSKYKRSVFYKNYSGDIGNIYLGFYLTEDVKTLRFSEDIQRKQDIEFLTRLKKYRGLGFYNANEVEIKYILKHDKIGSLIRRAFNQGQILFQSVRSSRLVHFIPLVCALCFLGSCILAPDLIAYVLVVYGALCAFFGFAECKSLLGGLLGLFIFPCVHTSYVLGNAKVLFGPID